MNNKPLDIFHVYLALSVVKSRPQGLTIEEYILKLRDKIRRKACPDRCHDLLDGLMPCARCHDGQSSSYSKLLNRSNQKSNNCPRFAPADPSILQREKPVIDSHLPVAKRCTPANTIYTTSVYDHIYEYTQRIKSTIHQDDGHTNMTEQSLLDGTALIKFVVRAISGDDEATISLPTRDSLPGQKLVVPAFALLEVQKMQMALSELLHTISNCLAKAESLEEGMRQEEDAVQSLSPLRSYLDLMQFMLQMLLRNAREEQRRVSSGTSFESAEPIILDRSSKKTDFLLGLLRETIMSLNADDSQHRYIFNQFMRFLFIYVAQGLHFLEFTHSEMDDIEQQIQQSAHVDFESAKRRNEQTYATESTYTIKVLETMLMLAPSFYRSSSCLPDHSCPIKESTKQIRFCKRHLQKLLAEIAFGYSFNPKLEDISISPTISDYRLSSYPIETVGVAEWFKSSLWLLVGWDILQSNPSHSQVEIGFFNYNS